MVEKRNVVIVGSGPSGWAAAIYASRAQLEPVLLAGEKSGGQLMLTTDVENYPGFEEGIQGPQLMMTMRKQAERFGTTIVDRYATAVDFSQRPFKIWTAHPEGSSAEDLALFASADELATALETIKKQEHAYEAESVIISTGAISLLLGVAGERAYMGRGVSTCAVCDAAFYKDKVTYVVGGGDAAMEEVLALVKFAKSVTLIHRRDSLKASKIMQQRVLDRNKEKVTVLWNTEVREILGNEQKVTGIKVENVVEKQTSELPADGVFIAIGHTPMTQFLQGQVSLNEKGYVQTGITGLPQSSGDVSTHQADLWLKGFPTMTNVEGVFAAGDVVDFRYRQAITAAGNGTQAALDAEWWLERVVGLEVGGTSLY